MSELGKEFGRNVRTAMAIKDMRQMDLCKATGMNAASISNYFSGKNYPSQEKIEKIAEALDMTPEALLNGRAVWVYGEKAESIEDLLKSLRQELKGIREELKGIKGRV